MKLLHVDSSITGTQSVSRQLTAEIVAKLRQVTPDLDILPGPRSQAGAAARAESAYKLESCFKPGGNPTIQRNLELLDLAVFAKF